MLIAALLLAAWAALLLLVVGLCAAARGGEATLSAAAPGAEDILSGAASSGEAAPVAADGGTYATGFEPVRVPPPASAPQVAGGARGRRPAPALEHAA